MSSEDHADQDTARKRKRVNVTLNPAVHDEGTNQAEEQGLTFSRYVERLVSEDCNSENQASQTDESQIIGRKVEDNHEILLDIREGFNDLLDLVRRIANQIGSASDHVAVDIETALNEAEKPLSIPDLEEELPHNLGEIEAGIQRLEQEFAVNRIESKNRDIDYPHWELKK